MTSVPTPADPTPGPSDAPRSSPPRDPSADVWPYIVPMIGFVVLTSLEGQLPTTAEGAPSPFWYPLGYALKVVIVTGLVLWARTTWRDLVPWPSASGWLASIGLGILVIVAWVGLDGRYPEIPWLGKRTAFDPAAIPLAGRVGFLATRFFGLVVLVPLIEEMFYRSFVTRWMIDPDFARVPLGKVTLAGVAATTALFTFSHPEWLPALITALAWAWLLHTTKSVSACVVSHAVANFVLGVYVLVTGDWKFW